MSDEPIDQPDHPEDTEPAEVGDGESTTGNETGERQADENRQNDPPA